MEKKYRNNHKRRLLKGILGNIDELVVELWLMFLKFYTINQPNLIKLLDLYSFSMSRIAFNDFFSFLTSFPSTKIIPMLFIGQGNSMNAI